jgi:hypothetical protein
MDIKIALKKPLSKTLKSKIESCTMEVGILEDRPHKRAKKGLKSLAGGPAQKVGKDSGLTIAQVARFARASSKVNFWTKPFQTKAGEITKFFKVFIDMVFSNRSSANVKRLENLLGAMVRGPILRGEYGRDKNTTAAAKGFNRKLIATGQLFSAIRGRVRFGRGS